MNKNNLEAKIVKRDEGLKLNVLGDNQIIKLSGKDTNGSLTLIEQNNEPGIGIPVHVHGNEDEVFEVLTGQVEMTIGSETTVLESGDLIFCPRGIPHSWRIVGTEKAKAILTVYPSGIENMFIELSELPPGPPDFPLVAKICGKYGVSFV